MLSLSDIWYSDAIGYLAIYQISGIALSTESHPAMSVTNGSLIYLLPPDIEQKYRISGLALSTASSLFAWYDIWKVLKNLASEPHMQILSGRYQLWIGGWGLVKYS